MGSTRAHDFFLVGPKDPKISARTNFFWVRFPVAIFKTGNGESGNGNREWGTGNGESLKRGIFKTGNL